MSIDSLVKSLEEWVVANKLSVEEIDGLSIFKIADESFMLLPEVEGKMFSEDFHLLVTPEDEELAKEIPVKNYCFKFGNNFYYTPIDSIEKPQLNPLKYLGKLHKPELADIIRYSFLGVRGKYELCNGSGDYKQWIAKAKFLGVSSLGICEHNTLAGTLPFQMECKKKKIKFILGETVTIKSEGTSQYLGKCYVINEEGWFNLLYINKIINVDNVSLQYIEEESILKYGKGLVFVFDSSVELDLQKIERFKSSFDYVYYQVDTTEYKGYERERQRLTSIKSYLDQFMEIVPPVLIHDAFYLDSEYAHTKRILNKIGGVKLQYDSVDQYFKDLDQLYIQWTTLFKTDYKRGDDLFFKLVENTNRIADLCNYEIETGVRHLPKFEHTGDESNLDLFIRLLEEGMSKRVIGKVENEEIYWERLDKEIAVIEKGKVVDYFLILWDIVNWCNENNILVGIGRGSGAGCLCTYLLGITGLDPIEYDLLFERFLNEGRVQTSLPDLDTDFEGRRRDEVKRYMENKYGKDFVCSVGTYGSFKLRSALKDIGKQFNVLPSDLNYASAMLDLDLDTDSDFRQIFKQGIQKALLGRDRLKKLIISHPHVIDTIPIVLKQPKNASVHACATLILPKEDQNNKPRDIYNWIPVKEVDGVLVSEWEGGYLEEAGFLKEDILGIKQLDKFRSVFNKVKENRGITLRMEDVDLKDAKIYELFCKGLSADVFHFGSRGLTNYAQEVRPTSIHDMIAMISLYRPGTIESNTHIEYVKLKNKEKEPQYDYMLEEVTRETYGLYVYQEQVMKAVQVLGGFDLVTADDIRKAMGKMKMDLIKEYKVKFIEGAVKNGCDEYEAEGIWNKLEAFASYGFNKSHAASYSITGVICQWLKIHYPIEFWSTAFEFAEDHEVPRLVSEIEKYDFGVRVLPPNVNESSTEISFDAKSGKIYWAINKIKFVGDVATQAIIDARQVKGEFFSIEDFCKRVDTSKVNKRVVEHLILAGCFDSLHHIEKGSLSQRGEVLARYYDYTLVKPEQRIALPVEAVYDWWWVGRQKEISGLGHFDFPNIVYNSELRIRAGQYLDPGEFLAGSSVDREATVAGLIVECKIRTTKRKDEFAALVLQCNDEQLHVLLWPDVWVRYKSDIEKSQTKLLIVSGTVVYDGYKKCNALQSNRETQLIVY